MHHGVDPVLRQQPRHQREIADIADDELPGGHRLPEPPAEVIEDNDLFGRFAQLTDDVAADVAGTAGD